LLMDFQELEFHLLATRPGVKPDVFVGELLHRWLLIEKERRALRENGVMHGYQWKNVFLPDGTSLRTNYHHSVAFAKVVGDRLCAESGEVLTPSSFANRGAAGRNAWRFIWLRFPGEEHWVRAADYRQHFNPASNAVWSMRRPPRPNAA